MRELFIAGLVVFGLALASNTAFAQRRAVDEFANRRAHAKWEEKVRKEQARAKHRVIPTFTIPQPAYGYGYPYRQNSNYPYGTGVPMGGGNYDYVVVPGGYQVINGQLQYVPAHYVLVPRYSRW